MAINQFNDRPFTDHQKLLELQEVNGVQVGQGLNSRFSAKEIILHIAKEMRRKACATVIKNRWKIYILIDESTTYSHLLKSTVIVYLKCETDKLSDPHFLFLDLLEIPDQTANTITNALLECLTKYGFDEDFFNCINCRPIQLKYY